MIQQWIPQAGKYDVVAGQAVMQALSNRPSYDVSPKATAEYFKAGVADPVMREFDRSIKPKIDQAYAAKGAFLSSRRGTETANALGDIGVGLSSQLAQWQQSNQALSASLAESAANRQMQGVGMANQQAMMPLMRSQALMSALSPWQAQSQQELRAKYQEWLRTRPESNPALDRSLSFLNVPATGFYGSQSQPSAGAAAGAAGLNSLSQMAMLYGLMGGSGGSNNGYDQYMKTWNAGISPAGGG